MAAGVTSRLWGMADLVAIVEAAEPAEGARALQEAANLLSQQPK